MIKQRPNDTFRRLRNSYLIALGLIALAVIAEQSLVGSFIDSQRDDAEIINVAGRQRMLSQRIVKQLAFGKPDTLALMERWSQSHEWLKSQLSSTPVYPRLKALDPIVSSYLNGQTSYTDSLSEQFLIEMDAIVNDLSAAAADKVVQLQRTKWWLGAITLAILLLELLFIFRPITAFVGQQIRALKEEKKAQEEAKTAAEEAVRQRENSLRELHQLNEAIDEAVLFATLRRDGSTVNLSNQFRKLLDWQNIPLQASLLNGLHPSAEKRAYFQSIINKARAGSWQGEWEIVDGQGNQRWLEVTVIPARRGGTDQVELFLLANDITKQKDNQEKLEQLTQDRIAEQVARSKVRSRQITEAQEKERLRIARDLHDGIGQKLTGLKLGLESLEPAGETPTDKQVDTLRKLAKEIILAVRVATFNLSPPELSDYGLAIGLERLCKELRRLTGQEIIFEANGFDTRFDTVREISIFRITQEAINNAIKYAEADYILVTISPGESLFSITVTDNGQGFDADVAEEGTGLGLRNMVSRVEDLNGRLFVHSDPDTGTKITINLPMPTAD